MIRLMARTAPEWLYHFTSLNGLIGIATDQALFSTHIAYLNDTAERLYGMEIISRALAAIRQQDSLVISEREFLDQVVSYIKLPIGPGLQTFVTSFAKTESLAMYRMYCPPDEGHALRVTGHRLSLMASRQNFALQPCIYGATEQQQVAQELVQSLFSSFQDASKIRAKLEVC